jgi:hypothetical protein
MQAAASIVGVIGVYAAVGVLFAAAFLTRGVGVIDPIATNSGWGLRVSLFPGAVAFWPLLAKRWWTA